MATELPNDFKEFLKLLNQNEVRYLVVGGFAVGFHGYPRTTDDLDVWIARDDDNARRLAFVLRQFGFGDTFSNPGTLMQAGKIFRLGHPPVRIEIHTDISGGTFELAYARKQNGYLEDTEALIISKEDLLANKKATGRYKDLNDIENLFQN